MAARKKRKPDFRRIRTSKTYTLPEIAEALDCNIATVRRWVRDGLPLMDNTRPSLVDGEVLLAWLKERWASRKSKCAPDELYCLKCRAPSHPKMGSVSIRKRNAKTLTICAKCEVCGIRMNRAGSLKKRTAIEATFRAFTKQSPNLTGYEEPTVKRTFPKRITTRVKVEATGEQIAMNFDAPGDQPAP